MSGRAPIEVMPLGDVLVRAARRWPESIAVAFPDRRLTTVELLADAYRIARGLYALGVRRGERVGIVAPNCVDYHAALFGGALLGVEVVTVNARFRATELAYVFEDAALAAVLTSDVLGDEVDFVGLLRGAIPNAPSVRHAVMLGASSPEGFVDRAELDRLAETVDDATIDAAADRVRVRDVAIMMYTSGTTAQPKGCPLTHEAIVRTSQAMVTRFALTGDDVWWDPLPMFHLSSILPLTCALLVGSPFATMVDFEPGTALAQVERERVTFLWSTFPTITRQGTVDESEGVEFEVTFSPMDNWQIYATATFMDIKTTKATLPPIPTNPDPVYQAAYEAAYHEAVGMILGAVPEGSTERLASLWTRYTFDSGPLKNLWLGGGFVHTGEKAQRTANPTLFFDAYTTFDLVVGYDWKWSDRDLAASLSWKNIANEEYFPANQARGLPERLLLSLSVKF